MTRFAHRTIDMYRASLETRNFHFEAFGKTEQDAYAALRNGFGRHASQYQLEPSWWRQFEGDITLEPLSLDTCYRDRAIIHSLESETPSA